MLRVPLHQELDHVLGVHPGTQPTQASPPHRVSGVNICAELQQHRGRSHVVSARGFVKERPPRLLTILNRLPAAGLTCPDESAPPLCGPRTGPPGAA